MPILLYGVEACSLNKSDIRSLDYILNRFFCESNNLKIIATFRETFGFRLPSELIARRTSN